MRCFALCVVVAATAFAAEPMPPAKVKLIVNGTAYESGAKISARPGERLSLEAKVFGARRAWCMEPSRYAELGRKTKVLTNGEDGLSFTTGPGFNGVWKIGAQTAAWLGQLNDELVARPNTNTATITVPSKPGDYALTVKASATWHYDRTANGKNTQQEEKNEAEVLDGQFALAEQNLAGLQETLGTIRSRIETLKKEKPGFSCTITFIGTPMDKGMKRVSSLETMKEQWKKMHSIVTGNSQSINTMLQKTQMVFSNNILKSVVKNYLDWANAVPSPGDFFGAVPVKLQGTSFAKWRAGSM